VTDQATKRPQSDASSRRARRADERWENIVRSAIRVFGEKGYDRTTIRDVAEEVGMLGGSLYYYIDSKEDLLVAVLEEAHRRGWEALTVPPIDETDVLTAVRTVVERHVTFIAENALISSIFYYEFRNLSPDRRQSILELRQMFEDKLRRLIERGREEGIFDLTVDPHRAAVALQSLMNAVHQWFRPERQSVEEVARDCAELVIGSLIGPPAARLETAAKTTTKRRRSR